MARKTHTAEEIVRKLRQAEVLMAQGRPVAEAIGVTEVSSATVGSAAANLDGEVFYSLAEAKVAIESRRRHDNTSRPHAALGCRPPAPEVVLWTARPTTRTVAPKPIMH